jgi:hypothetical protein
MGFIAAGLSVLMMAPVAEHLMMSPEDKKGGDLTAGFDQKGPLFPDGTTIYENGTGGFSPGSLVGNGTDVITPLNVRDPAALVMGPGATQKPAATVTPPAAPPEKSNWKDALSQAAGRGAKKAVSKAKLPKPNVKMSGALRGLSSLSGASRGGGPSMKLDAPSAGNVPNKARGSDSLSRVQSVPGLRGVGRRSNASSGSPESLRNAGARAGNLFNSGGAASALDAAAAQGIPSGGGGFGGGGPSDSKAGKGPGGNNSKGQRSVGESLAFLRAKKEQDKAIDLKWKMKEWETFGKKKMIEEAVIKSAVENLLGKGIFEPLGAAIADIAGSMGPDGATKGAVCTSGGQSSTFKNTSNQIFFCGGAGNKDVWTQTKSKEGQTDRKLYQTCESCGAIANSPGPTGNTPGTGDSGSPQGGYSGHAGNTVTQPSGATGIGEIASGQAQNWDAAINAIHTKVGNLRTRVKKVNGIDAEQLFTAMTGLATVHQVQNDGNVAANKIVKDANVEIKAILDEIGGDRGAIKAEESVLSNGKAVLESVETLLKAIPDDGSEDLTKLSELEKIEASTQYADFKKNGDLVDRYKTDPFHKRKGELDRTLIDAKRKNDDLDASLENAGSITMAQNRVAQALNKFSAEVVSQVMKSPRADLRDLEKVVGEVNGVVNAAALNAAKSAGLTREAILRGEAASERAGEAYVAVGPGGNRVHTPNVNGKAPSVTDTRPGGVGLTGITTGDPKGAGFAVNEVMETVRSISTLVTLSTASPGQLNSKTITDAVKKAKEAVKTAGPIVKKAEEDFKKVVREPYNDARTVLGSATQ